LVVFASIAKIATLLYDTYKKFQPRYMLTITASDNT